MGDRPPFLTSARRYLQGRLHRLTGDWHPLIEARQSPEVIAQEMVAASIPTKAFFFLLALSSTIATFGLLANSAPAIIGAMIIAPLMTPIMGLAYGVVQLDWSQIARSLTTVLMGVLLVIAIGYVTTSATDLRVTGSEMINRAFPTLLDLGVAMAAGAAGAFSWSRESIRNSVAGVAIAVALVPPLAVVGIGLALGHHAAEDVGLSFQDIGFHRGGEDIAAGAFVLFLTNLAAIVIVAGLVMTYQGYGHWRRGLVGLVAVAAASALLMQPLGEEMHKLNAKSKTLRLLKTLLITHPDLIEGSGRLLDLSIRHHDGILHIHLKALIRHERVAGSEERTDELRQLLEEQIGEPLVLSAEVIPVDILSFESRPPPAMSDP